MNATMLFKGLKKIVKRKKCTVEQQVISASRNKSHIFLSPFKFLSRRCHLLQTFQNETKEWKDIRQIPESKRILFD